mmetsp:Transcript_8866/g.22707  ORF Transcript_8866/g.22707 Transcript_8866/m.22707 type:complete len:119 (+) Transcript_8866:219-575(+)
MVGDRSHCLRDPRLLLLPAVVVLLVLSQAHGQNDDLVLMMRGHSDFARASHFSLYFYVKLESDTDLRLHPKGASLGCTEHHSQKWLPWGGEFFVTCPAGLVQLCECTCSTDGLAKLRE